MFKLYPDQILYVLYCLQLKLFLNKKDKKMLKFLKNLSIVI